MSTLTLKSFSVDIKLNFCVDLLNSYLNDSTQKIRTKFKPKKKKEGETTEIGEGLKNTGKNSMSKFTKFLVGITKTTTTLITATKKLDNSNKLTSTTTTKQQ